MGLIAPSWRSCWRRSPWHRSSRQPNMSEHSGFWPSFVVDLGALLLAATFLFASVMKFANPEPLELMLRWAKVDQRLTRSGVRLLGGGEAALGVGLLLGWYWVPLAAVSFLLVGSIVLATLRRLGYEQSCGCFGSLEANNLSKGRLLFQAALVLVATIVTLEGPASGQSVRPFWALSPMVWPFACGIAVTGLGARLLIGATSRNGGRNIPTREFQ
jgi:hypothetical protein